MKFSEAMEKLQAGNKVTREAWGQSVHFKMTGCEVKSYQPVIAPYIYDESIMVSDGWLVDDKPEEYKFYEIIPFLQLGSTAKLKDWTDIFIYLDPSSKILVVHTSDSFPFLPDFESFIAQDWIVL